MTAETVNSALLLTVPELAKRWKVTRQTISFRVKHNPEMVPPFIIIGEGSTKTTVRFRLSDVIKYEEDWTVTKRRTVKITEAKPLPARKKSG